MADVITASRARARLVGSQPPRPNVVARWLAPRALAADLPWEAEAVARAWAATAVAGFVLGGLLGGPVLAVLALLASVVGPPVALHATRERRDRRIDRELPALLEAVARSLRSGTSLVAALQEAASEPGAAADDLAAVLDRVERGCPLGEALDRWTDRRPQPGVRLAVGVLALAGESGGSPARSVDGVAATLRERNEVEREVRALATQARTSAAVVTIAPLAFAALGLLGDGGATRWLLHTRPGVGCLLAGLTLDGVGAWWMLRLTQSPT